MAARSASDDLAHLAMNWPEASVVVTGATSDEARGFASTVGAVRFASGSGAMSELARQSASVVNGVVGVDGLAPSVAAPQVGNRQALANKESLVTGGTVMLDALEQGGGEPIPVDSEHSAIAQLAEGTPREQIHKIVLTASGGP